MFSILMGCATGVCALGVLNTVTKVPELWLGDKYYNDKSNLGFACGKSWWIVVPMVTGFLVGSLRYFVMPEKPKGFLSEVIAQHVDLKNVPWVVICTVVSLMGGASVGPEAALGALGGGMGILWARFRGLSPREVYVHTLSII